MTLKEKAKVLQSIFQLREDNKEWIKEDLTYHEQVIYQLYRRREVTLRYCGMITSFVPIAILLFFWSVPGIHISIVCVALASVCFNKVAMSYMKIRSDMWQRAFKSYTIRKFTRLQLNLHEKILYQYYKKRANLFFVLAVVTGIYCLICDFLLWVPGHILASTLLWTAGMCFTSICLRYGWLRSQLVRKPR